MRSNATYKRNKTHHVANIRVNIARRVQLSPMRSTRIRTRISIRTISYTAYMCTMYIRTTRIGWHLDEITSPVTPHRITFRILCNWYDTTFYRLLINRTVTRGKKAPTYKKIPLTSGHRFLRAFGDVSPFVLRHVPQARQDVKFRHLITFFFSPFFLRETLF